jgi:hypothetical protein
LSGKQLSLGFNSVENSVAQLVEACDREAKAIDIRLTSLTLDLQVANGSRIISLVVVYSAESTAFLAGCDPAPTSGRY